MAAISSTAGGSWSVGATWVGGVAPGIADDVTIVSPHNVTVDAGATRRARTITVNGTLTGAAGATMSISGIPAPGYLRAGSGGTITDEATYSNPFTIQNEGDSAGNKIQVTAAAGTMTLTYTRFSQGQASVQFGLFSREATPTVYELLGIANYTVSQVHDISSHRIRGRRAGRLAWQSSSERTYDVAFLHDATAFGATGGFLSKQLADLADAGTSLSMTLPYDQEDRIYIKDVPRRHVGGELVRPEHVVLVQDLR